MPKKNYYPPYNVFICPECDPERENEIKAKDFPDHLKTIHGITDTKGKRSFTKGKRSLMMHINKKPRHSSSYKWEIAKKTFYQYIG